MTSGARGDETGAPSAWITRFTHLIRTEGLVLDLAAGRGRHTRWLLSQGYRVVALDKEVGALEKFSSTELSIVQADLENGAAWPLKKPKFDAIVVTNYLSRDLFRDLVDSLSPDGVLLYETFGVGNEAWGRPRNPQFLLQPGELMTVFGMALNVVAYESGLLTTPSPRVVQRLCALGRDRVTAQAELYWSQKTGSVV